ncbi:carbohydrate ABC transporter permease [Paenibacillus mucilaginosus]|uniref:Arabinose transporter permease n=2 Tax=Paenibacillus mucilaginosus TaxID=61624 RepID=I0BQR7_9BACL|nr:sugar ABC transporter permease [Paenibacillus mucilaginosus]AEI44612.1 binding-protein-dependent transport systems inner membrane component [Paenibacillus mucilaginosus KNP414]AFH64714.1 arabinose transporter permease [Paenibacillus mucilaginosus K02]MCG7215548.1 sugar ABC transporter permease [Paenibacillus mucilaginosus]WDM26178.1 sugar ABC transporter permease [Paenibacillus mucilaginosus]
MKNHTVAIQAVEKKRSGSLAYNQRLAPYVFVAPFLITFILFFAYPVASTVLMSFQEVLPGQTKFIGFDNYKKLLNPTFYKAIANSAKYTVLTLLVLIPLPLVLAVFLNSTFMRGKNFFRSTLFVPALTSVVVAGTVFKLVFSELDSALANTFIGFFGIEPQKWLGQSSTALLVLVLLATWRWLGVNIIYFLSGLQSIPTELYESADIDGANTWDKFVKITLPLLKPVTIYVLTISIYAGFAMFTESYMLYNGNRSPKDMGLTIVGYIYQQGLEKNNLGLGSAIGLTLLGITMFINLVQLKITGQFRKGD